MKEHKNADVDRGKPQREWAQIVATSLIAVVGLVFTYVNSVEGESNRKYSMATQLMSNREESETNFRQSMFQPLINKILDDSLPLDKRITMFSIFENNFNDLFNSRALFDALSEAADRDSLNKGKIKKRLVSLARKTNEDQELLLSVGHDSKQIIKTLCEKQPWDTTFPDGKNDEHNSEEIKVFIDSIMDGHISAIISMRINDDTVVINNGNPIDVSYFDSPLADNIIVPDGDRIAVTLKDVDLKNSRCATIKIIHFPADFITTGYRPSFQKVEALLQQK